VSLRKGRVSSTASVHKLSLGLMRKTPSASLKEDVSTMPSGERADLFAKLSTGAS